METEDEARNILIDLFWGTHFPCDEFAGVEIRDIAVVAVRSTLEPGKTFDFDWDDAVRFYLRRTGMQSQIPLSTANPKDP